MGSQSEEPPTTLIIEDSQTTREILSLAFRRAGFLALCASSVRGAMGALDKVVPSLVIIDVGLPDDSGFAVCRRLRTEPAYSRVKIIVISGLPTRELDRLGFANAYDALHPKPFALAQLVETARSLVENAPTTARLRLDWRPSLGDRVRITTALSVKLGDVERHGHCVEMREILDLDDGRPTSVNVRYVERWTDVSNGGGKPERRVHPLQGQQAVLEVRDGRVAAVDRAQTEGWPSMLPPLVGLLLPASNLRVGDGADLDLAVLKGRGRATLAELKYGMDGTVTAQVDLACELDMPGSSARLAAAGRARVLVGPRYTVEAVLRGTLQTAEGTATAAMAVTLEPER